MGGKIKFCAAPVTKTFPFTGGRENAGVEAIVARVADPMVVQDQQNIPLRQLTQEKAGTTPKQTTCEQFPLCYEHDFMIIAVRGGST